MSYTTRYSRDKATVDAIKLYLDKYGFDYYDYTRYQCDDSKDSSEKIKALLEEAICKSCCSIEIVSHDIQGEHPWVQFERDVISNQHERILEGLRNSVGQRNSEYGAFIRRESSEVNALLGYNYVRMLLVIDPQYMYAYSGRGVTPIIRINFAGNSNALVMINNSSLFCRTLKYCLKHQNFNLFQSRFESRIELR